MRRASDSANASHEGRRSLICRHIDKLLAEMENALSVSTSKLVFSQHIPDLSHAQRRVIEDYSARIRAQFVQVLNRPEHRAIASRYSGFTLATYGDLERPEGATLSRLRLPEEDCGSRDGHRATERNKTAC